MIDLVEKISWQPIKTAPKDGTPVLLLIDYDETFFVGYWGTGKYEDPTRNEETTWRVKWDHHPFDATEPTHWMPVPPAPPVKP